MENKTDRRILRTRTAIKEAFFSLLETKPIEKITVRELCDRADINRSSFYDHYLDYPDFLDAMEREYAEELLAQFDELFVREDYPEVTMRKLLHLIRHSREAELLLSNVSSHNALRIFEEALKERAFQDWLKYGEITKVQAEYLFRYIVSGGFAVIQQWYQGGFAESEGGDTEAADRGNHQRAVLLYSYKKVFIKDGEILCLDCAETSEGIQLDT